MSLDYESRNLPDDSKLAMLKKLLLSDEQSSIDDLEARLSEMEGTRELLSALRERIAELDEQTVSKQQLQRALAELSLDPEELSLALPRAARDAARRDDKLGEALSPLMATAFEESVKRDPKALADAVSPIMGPAIRASITNSIQEMVQKLNQSLQNSFSPQGLKWRWESIRTGMPFAEVVLIHSLIYEVEHAFLIRREDGIVLASVTNVPEDERDPDMISSMITALQDFMHDALGGAEGDEFRNLEHGALQLYPGYANQIAVIAAVRGLPPESIRDLLQEVAEDIQIEFVNQLADFDGDTDVFIPADAFLRKCLISSEKKPDKNATQQGQKPTISKWSMFAWSMVGLLLLAGVVWFSLWRIERNREQQYREFLSVPDSVELGLHRGKLTLRGNAHDEWISSALARAAALRHVREVNSAQLLNSDAGWMEFLEKLRGEPGIVVTRATRDGDRYYVAGLRDPLANDPTQVLAGFELNPDDVQLEFSDYQSMEPTFTVQRVQQRLGTIQTVQWKTEGHTLVASGQAPHGWFVQAQRCLEGNPAIVLDVSGVEDVDQVAFDRLVDTIQQYGVRHEPGSAELEPGQEVTLDRIAVEIIRLFEAGQRVGKTVHVVVTGYVDASEASVSTPLQLAGRRARLVWKELVNREVPPEFLLVRSWGAARTSPEGSARAEADMRTSLFRVKLGD